MEALQQRNLGAGAVLNQHQERIRQSNENQNR